MKGLEINFEMVGNFTIIQRYDIQNKKRFISNRDFIIFLDISLRMEKKQKPLTDYILGGFGLRIKCWVVSRTESSTISSDLNPIGISESALGCFFWSLDKYVLSEKSLH